MVWNKPILNSGNIICKILRILVIRTDIYVCSVAPQCMHAPVPLVCFWALPLPCPSCRPRPSLPGGSNGSVRAGQTQELPPALRPSATVRLQRWGLFSGRGAVCHHHGYHPLPVSSTATPPFPVTSVRVLGVGLSKTILVLSILITLKTLSDPLHFQPSSLCTTSAPFIFCGVWPSHAKINDYLHSKHSKLKSEQ